MDSKLLGKVIKRIEGMGRIEAFLVLTVAAFNLAIVSRSIRPNKFVENSKFSSSFLEQCRQILPAGGETIGEFKTVVCLYALHLNSAACVPFR